jgi:hypothetical protein
MAPADQDKNKKAVQNDPGVSNEPQSNAAAFDVHIYTQISQIFERLGKMDQKLDHMAEGQKELKTSVDKHDRIVSRIIYTVGGIALLASVLWFVYEQFLEDRISFTPPAASIPPIDGSAEQPSQPLPPS